MNKYFTQNILKFVFLIASILSSGCGQSIAIDSPTLTPEIPQPTGTIIYSTIHGIFSFDIESETTNTIFSTDKVIYYFFVVHGFIYVSMGDYGVSGDIFKINLDGSDLERLTSDGDIFLFSVAPDNKHVAYSRPLNQLYLLDIQTKKSQLIFQKKDFDFILGPWSPEGKKFFFTQRGTAPERYPISPAFLYTLEDKTTVEFIPAVIDFGFSSIPTWSPDGKSIVLNRETESQSGELGIYILNIETNSLQSVATDILADQFEWSPNGSMLVYTSRTEPTRLYLFDVAKKETEIIYDGQASCNYQLWSPDSNYIAYFSNISGSPGYLNIQDVDGERKQTFESPPAITGARWLEE